MNTPFEIQAFDLNEIGRRGHGTIRCVVNGYWSQDMISLSLQRNFWSGAGAQPEMIWKLEFSTSSGGRQANVDKERGVACDLEAATNLGAAIIALAAVGRVIKATGMGTLESAFQAMVVEAQEQAKIAAAVRQALVDADPAYGDALALQTIDDVVARVKAMPDNKAVSGCITGKQRGNTSDFITGITITRQPFGKKLVFWEGSHVVSKRVAVTVLGELSGASISVKTLGD